MRFSSKVRTYRYLVYITRVGDRESNLGTSQLRHMQVRGVTSHTQAAVLLHMVPALKGAARTFLQYSIGGLCSNWCACDKGLFQAHVKGLPPGETERLTSRAL
jgi:hypothetical protein